MPLNGILKFSSKVVRSIWTKAKQFSSIGLLTLTVMQLCCLKARTAKCGVSDWNTNFEIRRGTLLFTHET